MKKAVTCSFPGIYSSALSWYAAAGKFCSLSFFLLCFLFVSSPPPIFANGVGFRDFGGYVSIINSTFTNNMTAIQLITTDVAFNSNHTIKNIWIANNLIFNSKMYGIRSDLTNTGAITIENNFLDNSNVPSTGPYTKNGRYGIRIQNHLSPSIANNTIQNFGRSGIQLLTIDNITVVNNYLYSNGSQDYIEGDEHFASGIQARASTFTDVSFNVIKSNRFAGIASYGTEGVIGPDNIIIHDGDPGIPGGGMSGGSLENCVTAAGSGGNVRGGILVRDLAGSQEMSVMCTNTITDNYYMDIAKIGGGTVNSCGDSLLLGNFFASAADAVYYFDAAAGQVNLDCSNPTVSNIIDAAGKPFGIVIVGSDSDVTVQNCTIKNAAMSAQYRATVNNNGQTNYIGAGIFIGNNATPYISNNYIFSNGWALLDDRIYTEAGASGIQMRCANANASIVNNIIVSNANDGLTGRETGGLIGVVNMGNTFRNNGRGGIGIFDGTTRNLELAYNTIYNNTRGIGVIDFDGDMLTITNNHIDFNQGNTDGAGGIGLSNLSGMAYLDSNTIRNNAGFKFGGIGVTASNGTLTAINNQISNNSGSDTRAAGGVGLIDTTSTFNLYADSNTITANSGYQAGGIGGTTGSASSLFISNNEIANHSADSGVGFSHFAFSGKGLSIVNNDENGGIHNNKFGVSLEYNSGNVYIGDGNIINYSGTGGIRGQHNSAKIVAMNNTTLDKLGDTQSTGFQYNSGWISIVNNTNINGSYGFTAQENTKGILLSGNGSFPSVSIYNNHCPITVSNSTITKGLALTWNDTSDLVVINNPYINGMNGQNNWYFGPMGTLYIKNNTYVGIGNFSYNGAIYNISDNSLVNFTHAPYGPFGWQGSNSQYLVTNNSIVNGLIRARRNGGYGSVKVVFSDNLIVNASTSFQNINQGVQFKNNSIINGYIREEGSSYLYILGNSVTNYIMSQNSVTSIANNSLSGNYVSLSNSKSQLKILNNSSTAPLFIKAGANSTGISIAGNPLLKDVNINNNDRTFIPQITGNTITGASNYGVSVTLGGANISGNTIYGCAGGIGIDATTGPVTIATNAIYNNTNTLLGAGGIGLRNLKASSAVSIAGNTIYNNTGTGSGGGIGLYNPQSNSVAITGNSISNNSDNGIGVYSGSGNVTIDNNDIFSNIQGGAGFGNFAGTAVITDNTIWNNGDGVAVDEPGGIEAIDLTGNIIIDNNEVVSNNNVGIGFLNPSGSANITIQNNRIANNVAHGSFPGAIGVFQPDGADMLIHNNRIYRNYGSAGLPAFVGGIGFKGEATGSTIDATISSNEIAYHSNADIGYDEGALSMFAMLNSHFTVINNNIHDNHEGIRNIGAFAYIELQGNNISSNESTGIGLAQVQPLVCSDNTVKNNGWSVDHGQRCLGSVSDSSGLQFIDCDFSEFKNNIVSGNYCSGVQIINSTGIIGGPSGEENTFYNNGGVTQPDGLGRHSGIAVRTVPSGGLSIAGNIIHSNWTDGIGIQEVTNKVILGTASQPNSIYGNKRYGIGINQSELPAQGAHTIENNTVYSNVRAGIAAIDTGILRVVDNLVFSNGSGTEVVPPTTRPDAGIRVSSGSIINFINNTLRNNKGFGVSFTDNDAGNAITVSDNIIFSNSFSGVAIGVFDSISNQGTFYIDNSVGTNQISYNRRSGISFTATNNVSIQNNIIVSNGQDNYELGGKHDASGIRTSDSVVALISGNTMRNNKFSGIASYNTYGTIGPNNTITYNGIYTSSSGTGGSMENCVITPGNGGDVRGGVLARDLGAFTLEICGDNVGNNYTRNFAQIGTGIMTSCGNTVQPGGFFATAVDAVIYMDEDTKPNNLDCSAPLAKYLPYLDANSMVNAGAGNKGFGVIIVGANSDATISNCTIKNAATVLNNAVTTPNGTIIGAGIFIGNDATPSITNNYIVSNGWALLDDRIYTEAGASGIQMRCAEANTSIVNNIIASNANDGIAARESGALIGLVNDGNTFRNNGRGGIGLTDGTTRNLEIAYNIIYSNKRGIGALDFDGMMLTIANNIIYSNDEIGLGFMDFTGASQISGNTIYNNGSGTTPDQPGGIGATNLAGSLIIDNNDIISNQETGLGFFQPTGTAIITIQNNRISNNVANNGQLPGGGIGVRNPSGATILIHNNEIYRNQGNPQVLNYSAGIAFDGQSPTYDAIDAIISSNDIAHHGEQDTGKTQWGIGINQMDQGRFTVINNNIHHNFDGIRNTVSFFTQQLSLMNNSITNNENVGVRLWHLDFWGSGNVIADNGWWTQLCSESMGGIALNTCVINEFKANQIYGNYCNGLSLVSASGIIGGPSGEENLIYNNGSTTQPLQGELGLHSGISAYGSWLGLTLAGNLVYSNMTDGIQVRAIYQNMTVGNATQPNKVYGNGRHGIGAMAFSGEDSLPFIQYNEAYSNAAFGIALNGGSPTVQNNTVYNNAMAGIGATDTAWLSLAANLIYSNGSGTQANPPTTEPDAGIRIMACADVIAQSNIVRNNNGFGLSFADNTAGQKITVSDNTIFNNSFTGAVAGVFNSVNNQGTFTIENSTIYNNGGGTTGDQSGGIGFSDLGASSSVWVNGNTVYNNNRTGAAAGGVGLNNVNSSSVALVGNSIDNNDYHGVGIINGTGNITIDNNYIFSNNHSGLGFKDFAGTARITGNTIKKHDNIVQAPSTGYTVNTRGIGITNMSAATFLVDGNRLIQNGTGLGMTLGNGTMTFSNNEVAASIPPGHYGLTAEDVDLSAGFTIENNDENGGFHDLNQGVALSASFAGAVNIINNNIFSNCGSAVSSLPSVDEFNIVGNTKLGRLEFLGLSSVMNITDNSLIYAEGAPNAIRMIGIIYTSVNISRNEIASNKSVNDLITIWTPGSTTGALTVSNNVIHGASDTGISIINLSSMADHKIYSNTIYDNGTLPVSDNDDNGIALRVCSVSLYNNTIYSNINGGVAVSEGNPIIGIPGSPNTIRNNNGSGISLTLVNAATVQNNFIVSNGLQDYESGGQHNASGIRARDSIISLVSGNTLRNNKFSGIASYNTNGTIGPNNTITYNGIYTSSSGTGGSMENCVITPGNGGNVRGGVLARDLGAFTLEICGDNVGNNYTRNFAQIGTGTMTSCGNTVQPGGFFAEAADAVIYMDEDTKPNDLDCSAPLAKYLPYLDANSMVNAGAGDKAFGIIIVGANSDATISNCTIKNAATVLNNAVTTPNGTIIGAGIFIANDATPSITNNYIVSNGWALLDDRIYTEAGASGIQMRCAEANTSIVNNIIVSNANDGLIARESGALIGVVNQGNTLRNNGRGGIGLTDGTTRNLEIAYNTIYSNKRGIGALNFDGTMLTIANNIIYSNQGNYSAGGIGVTLSNGTVYVTNNTIKNNLDSGIGFTDFTGMAQIYSNEINNNGPSGYNPPLGVGGIAGVIMRSVGSGLTLQNNNILANNGEGVAVRDSSPLIGGSDAGNTLINNTRMGIGMSGSGNPQIGYNYLYMNLNGGIGLYSVTNSVEVYSNYIYSNIGKNNPGGVGALYMQGAVISIRNNTIYSNSSDQVNNVPWGIGIGEPDGGTVIIDNNVIASNGKEQGSTMVGGIGIQGADITTPGTLDNLYITSNRISGHGKKRAGIAFQWYSGPVTIRNNKKDNLGLSSNAEGIRFQELAPNSYVHIENNLFLDQYNLFDGGSAIEFQNSTSINALIANNTMDNCDFQGTSSNQAAIAFQGSLLYSVNSIKLTGNTISNSNGKGIIFTNIDGAGTGDIAHITLSNNYVFSNSGGIGILDLTDAMVNLQGNTLIKNNSSDIGAIGVSIANGTFSLLNNIVFSNENTGSGAGGIAFNGLSTLANVRIEGNEIYNNIGLGISGAGGVAFREADSNQITLLNNTIHNNTGTNAGGIGASFCNASFSFVNNLIYSNTSTQSGAGGIGVANLYSPASVMIQSNTILNNSGGVAGGIGGTSGNASSIVINDNEIANHNSSAGIGFSGFTFSNALSVVNNNENGGIHDNSYGIRLEDNKGDIYIGDSNLVSGNNNYSIQAQYNYGGDIAVDGNMTLDNMQFQNNIGHISITNNAYVNGYGLQAQYNTGEITFLYNGYIHYMDFQNNSGDVTISNNTTVDEVVGNNNSGSRYLFDNNGIVGIGALGWNSVDLSISNNSIANLNSGWTGSPSYKMSITGNSFVNGTLQIQTADKVLLADNLTISNNLQCQNISGEGVQLLSNSVINGSFQAQNSESVYLLGNSEINNTVSVQNSTVSIANNLVNGNYVRLSNGSQIDVLNNIITGPLMVQAGASSAGIKIANNSQLREVSINNNGYSLIPEVVGNTIRGASNLGLSVTMGGASIVNNLIYSCTGGIGIDAATGLIIISANEVYSNINLGSGAGGIGFLSASSANVSLVNNLIYNNIGSIVGGIGITNSNGTTFYMDGNIIQNNIGNSSTEGAGGIGFRYNSLANVSLTNNTIYNNEGHAGGIGLRTTSLTNNTGVVYSNLIYSNAPNGIQVNYTDTAGYSPKIFNNTVKNSASEEINIFNYSNNTNDQVINSNWMWATTNTTGLNRDNNTGSGDIYLEGNRIYTASVGFYNGSSGSFSVSNNTVTNSPDSFNPDLGGLGMVDLGNNDPNN